MDIPITDPTVFTATLPYENIENTRILAVCCIPPENSAPDKDGWFLSDFFAIKHVLEGTGIAQTWVACEFPKEIVEKHNAFLHRNPHHDRKVELNMDLVQKGFGLDIVVVPENRLCDGVSPKLQKEVNEAKMRNQPLLVLVSVHGYEVGDGWWMGSHGLHLFERARL